MCATEHLHTHWIPIEPGSKDFQSSAMTTFAKAAVVPCDRIELPSLLCKSKALPLDEQGMGCMMGFEPTHIGITIRDLKPLDDTHHIEALSTAGLGGNLVAKTFASADTRLLLLL